MISINYAHMTQSLTSGIRGHMYSECLVPKEYFGAAFLLIVTFSGLCAPGPGFLVLSPGITFLPNME